MPGAAVLVDELVEHAVAADQVMRAHLALRIGQRVERARRVVVRRVVEDDEVRPPLVVVGRGDVGRPLLRRRDESAAAAEHEEEKGETGDAQRAGLQASVAMSITKRYLTSLLSIRS